MKVSHASALLLSLCAGACSSSEPGNDCGGGCGSDEVCVEDSCRIACNTDANCDSGDFCSAGACIPAVCGDGLLRGSEECDAGPLNADSNGCTSACTMARCGDGLVYIGVEDCDDGNLVDGDGCAQDCTMACGACDDGNPCTDDLCDAGGGCRHVNNTATCDDSNVCSTVDSCVGGVCVGAAPLDCNDGNVCTDDSCDATGGCANVSNSADCSDGDVCTTVDVCVSGTCVGSDTAFCDDGNPCTDDSCSGGACTNTNNTNTCDDGVACTAGDSCKSGICVGGLSSCAVVAPLYPANGNRWLEYVKDDGVDVFHATDIACAGTETGGYWACIHGGEKLEVEISTLASCGTNTMTDDLGAFDWVCDDSGSLVTFYSVGLKPTKGLADLITATTWRSNHVIVNDGSSNILLSDPAIWWNNPVTPLADNSASAVVTLNNSGTIYTLDASRSSNGYNLNRDRMALVVLPGATLSYGGSAALNCAQSSGETGGATHTCLVSAGGQKFTWIEGNLDAGSGGGNTKSEHGIFFSDTDFSVIRNVTTTGHVEYGILIRSGSSNNLIETTTAANGAYRGISIFNNANENTALNITTHSNATNQGFRISSSSGNVVDGLVTYDNGDGGLVLSGASNNTINNVTTYGNRDGVAVWTDGADNNRISNVLTYGNSSDGVEIGRDTIGNIVENVTAYNNGNDGVLIYYAIDTTVRNVWAQGSTGDGFSIFGAMNTNASGIVVANNSDRGATISNGSTNTVMQFVTSFNNTASGVGIYDSADVAVSNVVSFNNGSSTGGHGVQISTPNAGPTERITLTHITTANNYHGISLSDATDVVIAHHVAVNNRRDGTRCLNGTVTLSQIVGAHNGSNGIELDACTARATGNLVVGANVGVACNILNGAVGLVNNTCANNGASDANLVTGVNVAGSFVGKLLTDDLANASDASGMALHSNITDWLNFDNRYRGWGLNGLAFPHSSQWNRCLAGDTCRIWDWRLASAASVIRERSGDGANANPAFTNGNACPAPVNGGETLTDFHLVANTFLTNATEIFDDSIGDDDGLCESSEACLYSPNFGTYQGEGDYTSQTCVFSNGAVTGVTMNAFPVNGQ